MLRFVVFKNIFFASKWIYLFLPVHLRREVVPSPEIVINLPRNYEKLHCNGESQGCNGYPTVQTDRDHLTLILQLTLIIQ